LGGSGFSSRCFGGDHSLASISLRSSCIRPSASILAVRWSTRGGASGRVRRSRPGSDPRRACGSTRTPGDRGPGIMSESEPTLTRTYSTAIARRASLERVQCGLLGISVHTPMRIRRCQTAFARLPRAGESGTWQGKMVYSSAAGPSVHPPRRVPTSCRGHGVSTHGNRP